VSNFQRSIFRRQWRSDHPPQWDRTKKQLAIGRPIAPRRSFTLWLIEKLNPKLYARLVEKALGKAKSEGRAKDVGGEVVTADPDGISLDLERVAERLDEIHGVEP
jgi:hypothetical protein